MNQKEIFLREREREFQTTIKVLRALPEEKKDLRPAAMSKTARELSFVFTAEEILLQKLLKNEPLGSSMAEAPATVHECIAAYEHSFAQTNQLVHSLSDEDLQGTADFFVGPKTPGKVPKINLCWMLFYDSIHHRGQFSVYLRMAGAKVPSIYGPTADEPWT
jgi:uncharacterized damage-inducible protein DinB